MSAHSNPSPAEETNVKQPPSLTPSISRGVAFGAGGAAAHVVMELFARGYLCVAAALLRSIVEIKVGLFACSLHVTTTAVRDFLTLQQNRMTLETMLESVTDLPATLHVAPASWIESVAAWDIERSLVATEPLTSEDPWAAVSPKWGYSDGWVIRTTSPELADLDDPDSSGRIAESVALMHLVRRINRGACICARCTGGRSVVVVTGSRKKKDGDDTCMAADLEALLERPGSVAVKSQNGSLTSQADWVRRNLLKALAPHNPGIVLLARGGGFEKAEVDYFRRTVEQPIADAQALGWEVHVAIGHANCVIGLPWTFEHPAPRDAKRAIKRRLDGHSGDKWPGSG